MGYLCVKYDTDYTVGKIWNAGGHAVQLKQEDGNAT